MSSNAVELARRVAHAGSTSTLQDAQKGGSSSGSIEESEPLPPGLQSLPEAIRALVPRSKLITQSQYFVFPPWVALPAIALHLECRREGVRMAPLALDKFPCYLMGNSSVCDFRLEHPSISRVHCALAYHGEKQCFVVVDLKSTNGIKVDGKRIEAGRPIPLPVGSVLQVGLSNRTYEMTRGRATKEGAAGVAVLKSAELLPTAPKAEQAPTTQNHIVAASTTADSSRQHLGTASARNEDRMHATEVPIEAPAPQAPVVTLPSPRTLSHILIKHVDSQSKVSGNPANKGEPITRSVSEALQLAATIRALHGDAWTLDDFADAARRFSECGTSKKGGALGVVSPGDFDATFESVALRLDVGAVSAPFATALGIHLVFCSAVDGTV